VCDEQYAISLFNELRHGELYVLSAIHSALTARRAFALVRFLSPAFFAGSNWLAGTRLASYFIPQIFVYAECERVSGCDNNLDKDKSGPEERQKLGFTLKVRQ
jgi:hypothetical protein